MYKNLLFLSIVKRLTKFIKSGAIMITIKDIAKKAGVSTATVSYVMNNSPKVSEDTKKRILKMAEEMGYKRNTVARSLRTNKTKTVGVIVEDLNDVTPTIVKGINKFAVESGYHIILDVLKLENNIDQQSTGIEKFKGNINQNIDILLGRQIEGIIYVGSHVRDVTEIIKPIEIPIVYSYSFTQNENDVSVNYDDKLAGYEATEFLIKHGHENIAIIGGSMDSIAFCKRLEGYKEALSDNDLNFNYDNLRLGDWSYEKAYLNAKNLLNNNHNLSAVFATNGRIAVAVMDYAEEKGLKLPKDLSVIGFDNKEFGLYVKPELSTMGVPLYDIGTKSMELLLRQIEKDKIKTKTRKLHCPIINRGSVAKR